MPRYTPTCCDDLDGYTKVIQLVFDIYERRLRVAQRYISREQKNVKLSERQKVKWGKPVQQGRHQPDSLLKITRTTVSRGCLKDNEQCLKSDRSRRSARRGLARLNNGTGDDDEEEGFAVSKEDDILKETDGEEDGGAFSVLRTRRNRNLLKAEDAMPLLSESDDDKDDRPNTTTRDRFPSPELFDWSEDITHTKPDIGTSRGPKEQIERQTFVLSSDTEKESNNDDDSDFVPHCSSKKRKKIIGRTLPSRQNARKGNSGVDVNSKMIIKKKEAVKNGDIDFSVLFKESDVEEGTQIGKSVDKTGDLSPSINEGEISEIRMSEKNTDDFESKPRNRSKRLLMSEEIYSKDNSSLWLSKQTGSSTKIQPMNSRNKRRKTQQNSNSNSLKEEKNSTPGGDLSMKLSETATVNVKGQRGQRKLKTPMENQLSFTSPSPELLDAGSVGALECLSVDSSSSNSEGNNLNLDKVPDSSDVLETCWESYTAKEKDGKYYARRSQSRQTKVDSLRENDTSLAQVSVVIDDDIDRDECVTAKDCSSPNKMVSISSRRISKNCNDKENEIKQLESAEKHSCEIMNKAKNMAFEDGVDDEEEKDEVSRERSKERASSSAQSGFFGIKDVMVAVDKSGNVSTLKKKSMQTRLGLKKRIDSQPPQGYEDSVSLPTTRGKHHLQNQVEERGDIQSTSTREYVRNDRTKHVGSAIEQKSKATNSSLSIETIPIEAVEPDGVEFASIDIPEETLDPRVMLIISPSPSPAFPNLRKKRKLTEDAMNDSDGNELSDNGSLKKTGSSSGNEVTASSSLSLRSKAIPKIHRIMPSKGTKSNKDEPQTNIVSAEKNQNNDDRDRRELMEIDEEDCTIAEEDKLIKDSVITKELSIKISIERVTSPSSSSSKGPLDTPKKERIMQRRRKNLDKNQPDRNALRLEKAQKSVDTSKRGLRTIDEEENAVAEERDSTDKVSKELYYFYFSTKNKQKQTKFMSYNILSITRKLK